jgi:transposase
VHDVPCTATARVRELSRGGRRKNDVIDAAAAASVAALSGDARPVVGEDVCTALALLDERRTNLVAQRTRLVNQLHALLRDLVPGGADTDLTPAHATRVLAGVRPVGTAEITRKLVARELVGEIRDIDARLKKLTALIGEKVAEHGSRLPQVVGAGRTAGGVTASPLGSGSSRPSVSVCSCKAGCVTPGRSSVSTRHEHSPQTYTGQPQLAVVAGPVAWASCNGARLPSVPPMRTVR